MTKSRKLRANSGDAVRSRTSTPRDTRARGGHTHVPTGHLYARPCAITWLRSVDPSRREELQPGSGHEYGFTPCSVECRFSCAGNVNFCEPPRSLVTRARNRQFGSANTRCAYAQVAGIAQTHNIKHRPATSPVNLTIVAKQPGAEHNSTLTGTH